MSDHPVSTPQVAGSPQSTPFAAPPQAPKMSALAVVALILGIVFPIGGIIIGPIAMRQTKRTGLAGYKLAKAGLIVGICLTILWLATALFLFWLFGGFMTFLCPRLGIGCNLPWSPLIY